MRFHSSWLSLVAVGAACAVAAAQTPDYKNVGRTPTAQEIQAMDIARQHQRARNSRPAAGTREDRRAFSSPPNAPSATAKARKASAQAPRRSWAAQGTLTSDALRKMTAWKLLAVRH